MTSSSLEIPPLRSLNDFILESARFQLPNFNDFEKWGNRVVKNLLYYQTNYFAVAAVFFAIMGIIHPIKILSGLIYVAAIAFVAVKFVVIDKKTTPALTKNATNSWLILLGVGLVGFFLLYIIEAILIVSFTVLVPFCAAFVHSSLRRRNLKNKAANIMEKFGFTNTPMGVFLDFMQVNPDIINAKSSDFFHEN
jgi:hypothetical protein